MESLLRHTEAARREHPATVGNLIQDDVTDRVRAEEKREGSVSCVRLQPPGLRWNPPDGRFTA
ncbi:hypothetical protein [Streptomyces sp. NPDC048411]|uniref:hypothetical protein n=1 Tax=Streptomyces sp. NPDC048411 TaxID=3157206 RepID=UPI00345352A6